MEFSEDNAVLPQPEELQNLRFTPAETRKQMKKSDFDGDRNADRIVEDHQTVYKLHLQLVGDWFVGAPENFHMKDEELSEFLHLAGAKESVSRDILIRGDKNLHELHYAIQKAFGWQNSHLHNFSLTPEDFSLVTGNETFGGFTDLCGILFRCPCGDADDIYWDDTTPEDEKLTPEAWFKRRYNSVDLCCCLNDSWLGAQRELGKFLSYCPDVQDGMTLEEAEDESEIAIEDMFNTLSERLTIAELFRKTEKREDVRAWKGKIAGRKRRLEQKLELYDEEKLNTLMDDLISLRMQQPSWSTSARTIRRKIREKEEQCTPIFRELNVLVPPYFDTLYYLYDYGDSWCIRITLDNAYTWSFTKDEFLTRERFPAPMGSRKLIEKVAGKGIVQCIAADGFGLVDDCGGIFGYQDMLRNIFNEDPEDPDDAMGMKLWAKNMGWRGLPEDPETLL